MYQKTYTTDSLPLKRYLNTGQRSKYYAMETHEGIISKTDYEKVQNLLAKKSITGEIDRTCVFSKKIYCSICGAICSRKGPPTQGFVWCCRTHLQSKALCLLKSIREDELQQAFLSIYNRLQCNQKTILEPLVDDLLGLRHLQEQKYKKRLALGEDIQHLAKQKHNLTRIHTLGYIEEPQFIERSAAIEQQIRERKQQLSRNEIQQHPEIIHNPKEQCNTRSIEVAQLDHEIHTALALPELDADAIIDKILRRAELQFNYCAAGDDDPTTMQIKRACKEFKPTDTFPESFYSSIVSKIILHLDTHIDIKLRNGQTL